MCWWLCLFVVIYQYGSSEINRWLSKMEDGARRRWCWRSSRHDFLLFQLSLVVVRGSTTWATSRLHHVGSPAMPQCDFEFILQLVRCFRNTHVIWLIGPQIWSSSIHCSPSFLTHPTRVTHHHSSKSISSDVIICERWTTSSILLFWSLWWLLPLCRVYP